MTKKVTLEAFLDHENAPIHLYGDLDELYAIRDAAIALWEDGDISRMHDPRARALGVALGKLPREVA